MNRDKGVSRLMCGVGDTRFEIWQEIFEHALSSVMNVFSLTFLHVLSYWCSILYWVRWHSTMD